MFQLSRNQKTVFFLIGHSYLFDNRKSQHSKLTLCMLSYLACFLSPSSSPCPIKTTAQWHKRQSSGILMPGYGLFTDSPPRLLDSPADAGLDLDLWYIENILTDYESQHLQTSESS